MNSHVITTVIGSYPILLERMKFMDDYFKGTFPSWKPLIQQAVNDMESAGINLISDGQTRDPFLHIFTRGLSGFRIRARAEVIGPISYSSPLTANDLEFVRSIIPDHVQLLGLLIGAHTLSESVDDKWYNDKKELAFDVANALAEEARSIEPYVDMISIDEPFYANSFPEYAGELIQNMKKYVRCPIRLHACGDVSSIASSLVDLPVDALSHEFAASPDLFDVFSQYGSRKGFCVGVVRSDCATIESVDTITDRINKARDVFGDNIIQLAPDCGLRLLPRSVAYEKLQRLVQATRKVYG